ncbi:MAG: hypothetical protein M1827_001050 [Pycnora praestabilis]|nr:MAG: hypothetical protein M1827_001050 [Pycnora praestabilis]
MALATAAAIGGTATAAAYLDAKFHIKKDVGNLILAKKAEREYRKAGTLPFNVLHWNLMLIFRCHAVKGNRQALWYFFEAQCSRIPNEECIWSRTGVYTWRETYEQSCRYAQYFISIGVPPGRLVALYLQNAPEFVFAWLGLWSIGCAPAMINRNLRGDALLHCLKISGAHVMLADQEPESRSRVEESRERIEELGMKLVILTEALQQEITSSKPTRPEDSYREKVTGDFPFALIYTSGTTGLSKACPFKVSTGYMMGVAGTGPIGIVPGPDGDRWYDCMPMYHGTGFIASVMCMLSGVTLCIGKRFSTTRFWDDVRESKATWFVYVGETARYLLAAPSSPKDKDHNVKGMYGNGLRPDVWNRFKERFGVQEVGEFFNSTEGVFALFNHSRGDYSANAVGHHGLIMRQLLRNTYVPVEIDHGDNTIVRDPATGFAQRQPYEVGGEIIVSLPNEAAWSGYWKAPEATRKRFERGVFKKGDLWYRTGDVLRRTDDGRWFFHDRLGDTYRWKSENVSTAEVAECFGRFPGVVEANVYGVLVPGHDGRAGCAALFIQQGERTNFDYKALLIHARQHLPRYAVPIFLRIVSAMTPIHNNKQNKVPLREEGVDPAKVGKNGGTGDRILWIPPGQLRDDYVEFKPADWESLIKEVAKL